MNIEKMIEDILAREGEYVDNPDDRGGPTMYGITEAAARRSGYSGAMRELPLSFAKQIYLQRYYLGPGFDHIVARSEQLAAELADTGVNMGPEVATRFLQRVLNVFNRRQYFWRDVAVDGQIGDETLEALDAFLCRRGQEGVGVLLKALNCLQGARYIELVEKREENESFVYGWLRERVE